jgi:hypothetical protein
MSSTSGPSLARWTALTALELNIGIHAALTPMHLDEMFYIGVLFCVGNAVLFLAMALLMSERRRALGWLLATATSAAELAAFVASRTVGLPRGYHETWTAQPEDLLGLVCVATDVIVIVAAAYLTRRALRVGAPASPLDRNRSSLPAALSM